MRKSSAIFVSAIALGLAISVPLKASAQGVSIYIGPGYPGYAYPAYPISYYGGSSPLLRYTPIQATVTPIQATAMAVRITALIGAITDALLAELIGDWTAGTEKPVPARTHGAPHSRMLRLEDNLRQRLLKSLSSSEVRPQAHPTCRKRPAFLRLAARAGEQRLAGLLESWQRVEFRAATFEGQLLSAAMEGMSR